MPKKRKTKKFFRLTKNKKQQMSHSFAVFVGWVLILWGSFYFLRKSFWQNYTVSKIITHEDRLLTKVIFPSFSQERKIVTTHVANGEWLLLDDAANYVYESARPRENGSIIIYGHNTPQVFADLHKLNFGDDIVLENNLGTKFYYQVVDKKIVKPDEIKYLNQNKETLILYTCTGFLDSKRLLIFATPTF